ncbi:MAG: outer membrane protein assembly factor BamE [Burkholderiales bacterium]
MSLRVLASMAALLLASCGSVRLPIPELKPYRIEIQQGNFISPEMVSQLKPGMTKDQVRFVLGTPLIADSFHADRWDYVFRRQRVNSSELEQRKIAVFFEDGKFKRVEGDLTPAADAGVKAPDARRAPAAGTQAQPAAQTASDAVKPAPGVAASQPDATPVPPAQDQPQEKSWWQRLKDKF